MFSHRPNPVGIPRQIWPLIILLAFIMALAEMCSPPREIACIYDLNWRYDDVLDMPNQYAVDNFGNIDHSNILMGCLEAGKRVSIELTYPYPGSFDGRRWYVPQQFNVLSESTAGNGTRIVVEAQAPCTSGQLSAPTYRIKQPSSRNIAPTLSVPRDELAEPSTPKQCNSIISLTPISARVRVGEFGVKQQNLQIDGTAKNDLKTMVRVWKKNGGLQLNDTLDDLSKHNGSVHWKQGLFMSSSAQQLELFVPLSNDRGLFVYPRKPWIKSPDFYRFRVQHVKCAANTRLTECRDELILVVVREEIIDRYYDWLGNNSDSKNQRWLIQLPRPMASICCQQLDDPLYKRYLGRYGWSVPQAIHPPDWDYFHPNAYYKMRSKVIPLGSQRPAHQATYDQNCRFIDESRGIEAGSADFEANIFDNKAEWNAHRHHDVLPFIYAMWMDANPARPISWWFPLNLDRALVHEGNWINAYTDRRPARIKPGLIRSISCGYFDQ